MRSSEASPQPERAMKAVRASCEGPARGLRAAPCNLPSMHSLTSRPLAVEARGLHKAFGATQALDGVDLTVPTGTVLGVLGPNGAGKTTAVRILATVLSPDGGEARIGGHDVFADPSAVRRLIGLTGQYASVDEVLTGRENLVMLGQLLDLSGKQARVRARELFEWFGLEDAADRPVRTYSGGMRRRLDLAASLVGRPAVVFLDEPTTGLDPSKRTDLWEVVRGLVREGSSVLLTTQYLEEADALADQVTVIDRGKVIADGTPNQLKRLVGSQTLSVRPLDAARLADVEAILAAISGGDPHRPDARTAAVPVGSDAVLGAVVSRLEGAGIGVEELGLHLPSLDEAFAALTGVAA